MSLYSDYLLERQGIETIELEGGFVTFLDKDNMFYIKDVYVAPEYRESKLASKLGNLAIEVAKERKFTHVVGSTCSIDPNFERNSAYMFQFGFKELIKVEDMMYFIKEI